MSISFPGNPISTCLNWQDNLICVDLNGKMLDIAAGYRNTFSRILRLSPVDKETLNFNVLDEITGERAFRDASMIADILLEQADLEADNRSKHWVEIAKDLLTGVILHCKCSEYRDKSMCGVLSILLRESGKCADDDNGTHFFHSMIDFKHCSDEIHEIIRNVVLRFNNLHHDKKKYVLSLVLNSIKIFDDPFMRRFSSTSDFCLYDFNIMYKPISLFITIPFSGLEMFYPYIKIIISMMQNIRLQRPTLLFLDECLKAKFQSNSIDDYCDNITVRFYKFNLFKKKSLFYHFLCGKKLNRPALHGRSDYLYECAETIKPIPESRQWFHIPEEAYMCSEDVIEPIFVSKVPNDDDIGADPESFSDNNLKKREENKLKDMELIKHEKIAHIDLFFNNELNESINELENILQIDNYNYIKNRFIKRGRKCGVICMLFGEPGTGKSEIVLQLAKKTKRDLLKVDLSVIRKKFVGSSEKAINRMFFEYKSVFEKSDTVPILFINEADGFFQKRIGDIAGSANKTLAFDFNTIQNMLLDKLECFEGILIGTSNFIENMDDAFDRRILYKVNFDKPDRNTQKLIWKNKLPELNDETVEKLTANFNFSGGIIDNIVKKHDINFILSGDETNYNNLEKLCKMEFKIKKVKSIGFMADG